MTANTSLLAQPAGDVPLLELPPPKDALTGTLSVIFTRSVDELEFAQWAIVDRAKYMQLVTDRKECCPVFKDVKFNDDGAAELLLENGVPDHICNCAFKVDGADRAISQDPWARPATA